MQRYILPADVKDARSAIAELSRQKGEIEKKMSDRAHLLLEHGALNPNYKKMREFGDQIVSTYFNNEGAYSFEPKLFYVAYTNRINEVLQAVTEVKSTLPEKYQELLYIKDLRVNLNITTPQKGKPLMFLNIDNNKKEIRLDNDFEMEQGLKFAEALKMMKPVLERELDTLRIVYASSLHELDKLVRK